MKLCLLFIISAIPALATIISSDYMGLTKEELVYLKKDPKVTHLVTFNFQVYRSETDSEEFGQMKFALFGELLPETVEYFTSMVRKKSDGYSGTIIHRALNNLLMEGGKMKKTQFREYEEIAFEKFPQENFDLVHNKVGRITLDNTKNGTNGVKFFIFVDKFNKFFDFKYVAFGQLVNGYDVLQKINGIPKFEDAPIFEVVISQARVYKYRGSIIETLGSFSVEKSHLIIVLVGLVLLLRTRRVKALVNLKI